MYQYLLAGGLIGWLSTFWSLISGWVCSVKYILFKEFVFEHLPIKLMRESKPISFSSSFRSVYSDKGRIYEGIEFCPYHIQTIQLFYYYNMPYLIFFGEQQHHVYYFRWHNLEKYFVEAINDTTYISSYTTNYIISGSVHNNFENKYQTKEVSDVQNNKITAHKSPEWYTRHKKETSLSFYDKKSQFIKKDVELWYANQKELSLVGLKHNRGCLLYGKPGTGKSMLIKNIAKDLSMRICFFNIKDCIGKFSFYEPNQPYILIVEDIDCVFDGRKNILQQQNINGTLVPNLSFEEFINKIDGYNDSNVPRYFIITTNHPEKLDEALIRRGRIDIKVEFTEMDKEDCDNMIRHFCGNYPKAQEKLFAKNIHSMKICDLKEEIYQAIIEEINDRDSKAECNTGESSPKLVTTV